jgi:arginyl-tRNA synthetase
MGPSMNLEALFTDRLAAAFSAVAGTHVDPAVRRSQHADFQSGAALPLARVLRRAPRDIAAEALDRADLRGVATAEVSGPGFVNLMVDDGFLAARLSGPLAPADGGAVSCGAAGGGAARGGAAGGGAARGGAAGGSRVRPERQTVVVDYSAPNVAKELPVGHLRSTILGDAAARLLERLGHDVRRANHLGDWGTPFGMLIEHLRDTGDAAIGDLTAFYRAARARFDADEDFRDRSRRRVVALQAGDPESRDRWRRLVDESRRHFLAVYRRLGVTLTDGDFVGESFYNDMLPSIVDELGAAGLLRVSDGALCAFPAGFAGRDGEPLPLIVRKSDGGFGYAATDLAALRHRVRELGATRLLYVVGAPQRTHFRMVFAVAREAGWLPDGVTAEHVAFGSILGADGKMFRSRGGDSVPLAALLDEAERRATAPEVGVGAIKYADLSSDRMSDYVFDWDRMLARTGDTGPYLQYAYARIRSIFDRTTDRPGAVRITAVPEHALALELLAFEPVLESVAGSLEFHRLTGYLHGLATAFSVFYERCPVLRAEDGVRESRLALCERTARTLREGLGLLGIAAPGRL